MNSQRALMQATLELSMQNTHYFYEGWGETPNTKLITALLVTVIMIFIWDSRNRIDVYFKWSFLMELS